MNSPSHADGEERMSSEELDDDCSTDQLVDDSDVPVHAIVHRELNIDVPPMSLQHGYCVEQIMDHDGETVADGDEEDVWAWENGEKLSFDDIGT